MSLFLVMLQLIAANGEAAPTFYDDIGPILRDHCVTCHSPGQVAPMSLRTYEEVRPWAKSILREVASKRMPPFSATGPVGRYKDDPRLSDEQIDAISDWVEGRQLEGTLPDGGWNLPDVPSLAEWSDGEPDIVISLPEYVAKDESEANPWVFSEHSFDKDTYIRAIRWRVTDPKLPHHIGVFRVPANVRAPVGVLLDSLDEFEDNKVALQFTSPEFLYTPGTAPNALPDGWATVIPKRTRFLISAHFAPGEVGDRVTCELGLYHAQGFVRPMEAPLRPNLWSFTIPPGESNYTLSATLPFPRDGHIEGFFVHMHYRGKSGRFYLTRAGEPQEMILEVPRYDFNWQRSYWLSEPIGVDAGTEIEFEATWDNSDANPANPDPGAEVVAGESTNDEMMSGVVYWRSTEQPGPLTYVRDGVKLDWASILVEADSATGVVR